MILSIVSPCKQMLLYDIFHTGPYQILSYWPFYESFRTFFMQTQAIIWYPSCTRVSMRPFDVHIQTDEWECAQLASRVRENFGEHEGNMREHWGNIEGTLREHSGNIEGTLREHWGNIVTRVALQAVTNGPLKMKLHYFQRDPTKRIGGSPYTRDDMGSMSVDRGRYHAEEMFVFWRCSALVGGTIVDASAYFLSRGWLRIFTKPTPPPTISVLVICDRIALIAHTFK